jgi:hypothetical protein
MTKAHDVTIPVADLQALYQRDGTPLKNQGIIIGGTEADEAISEFRIVRRNPPSKKYPHGSITVEAASDTDAGPVKSSGRMKIIQGE